MWASTSDVSPLQHLGAPVTVYRDAAAAWPWESRQDESRQDDDRSIRYEAGRYEAGNALTTAPQNVGPRKESLPEYHVTLLAEKSLAEDWLRPEEDEAWAHLQ
ncbi:MAG: hypothetical protein K6U10_02405 [Acidobacteriia bacterium]|nr:hypothetical protein [Methyloceanibacter sp.]MCL6490653.1 hypothetical protein [Terriglobia bacterium]